MYRKGILLSLLTIFVICTLTFFVMHLVPGGPFQQKKMSDVTREALNARYHLDQPLFTQYLLYMKGLLRGDLGVSINDGRLITDILKESFPISCKLGLAAVTLALVLGTVFGSVAALRNFILKATWVSVIYTFRPTVIFCRIKRWKRRPVSEKLWHF